jgi:glycolate oxidase FAD binding subunit
VETAVPADRDAARSLMKELAAEAQSMRIRGGGTKLGWGAPVTDAGIEVSTAKLDRVVEHNEGDFTAVVEAGVPMAELQDLFSQAGQRFSLDPPLGLADRATIGGVVACADAGPLRHRYGTARDLILGVTVALPDGSLAKAGGKVIKNVAGYDLPKLYAGSFGTLGLIVEVVLRLHPLPERTVTVSGTSNDPDAISAAARRLADSPLEPEALDVLWGGHEASTTAPPDDGAVLIRLVGAEASALAERARTLIAEEGLAVEVTEGGEQAWRAQRTRQRSQSGAVIRVSAVPVRLPEVLRSARDLGAGLVGRAAHGVSWLRLERRPDDDLIDAIARLRADYSPACCAVLDAPEAVRRRLDPFGLGGLSEQRLMASVKSRIDPGNACNPGLMGAGIG